MRYETLYLGDIKNRYLICVRNFEGHNHPHHTVSYCEQKDGAKTGMLILKEYVATLVTFFYLKSIFLVDFFNF